MLRPLILAQSALLSAAEPALSADLLLPERAPAPGAAVAVGVRLAPAPGWHTYWRNPGSSGQAPRLTWRLPPGWSAGEPAFPPPQVFTEAGTTYGYDAPAVLAVRLQPPAGAAAGPVALALTVEALVCRDACLPARLELVAALAVGGPAAPDPAAASAVAATLRPPPTAAAALATADGGGWWLTCTWAGPAPRLVPGDEGWLDDDAPQLAEAVPGGWLLRLRPLPGARPPARLDGLLIGGARHARPDPPPAFPGAIP